MNPPVKISNELTERFGDSLTEKSTKTQKAAAKGFVKGTKKFKDKVTKAKKAGMKNPEGFAAWAQHAATGKWPSGKSVNETRAHVTPQEVEVVFDDLYTDESLHGAVSLETLASWLGTTEEAVLLALPKHLSIDDEGYVVADW